MKALPSCLSHDLWRRQHCWAKARSYFLQAFAAGLVSLQSSTLYALAHTNTNKQTIPSTYLHKHMYACAQTCASACADTRARAGAHAHTRTCAHIGKDVVYILHVQNTEIFQVECIFGSTTALSSVTMALIAPMMGSLLFCTFFLGLRLDQRMKPCHGSKKGFPIEAIMETNRSYSLRVMTEGTSTPDRKSVALAIRNYSPLQLIRQSTATEQGKILAAAFVKLLFSAFPFFCVEFLSVLLGCEDLGDGTSRLVSFPSEDCHDNHWDEKLLPLSIVGLIVWCAGIPALGIVIACWRNLKQFDAFLAHAIFAGHQNSLNGFFWRVSAMVRAFYIALVSFLPLTATEQFTIFAMLLVLTVFMEARVQPRV